MHGPVRQALGLAAVSGLLFFTSLGGAELWDEDEPTFAGAAREMMARRDWVVPYFNSRLLPDKPVLSYWLIIASYRLLGPTEFAARAGSALFSIGSVLITWALGRKMFSARAGAWAGLALATSFNFVVVARAATPDAVLTFFCTLAVFCFVSSLRGQPDLCGGLPRQSESNDGLGRPSHGRRLSRASLLSLGLVGCYTATGVALLTKGPVGLLPAIAMGLFSLVYTPLAVAATTPEVSAGWLDVARRALFAVLRRMHLRHLWRCVGRMRPIMGLAIVLAVAGPWYVAVGLRTDGAWLTGFLGRHNVERFLHPLEHHRGPIYYYLIAAVVGLFPWSLFLGPVALWLKSRLADPKTNHAQFGLLFCWIGTYLLFFSLAATKLPNYILPIYPALALLVGAWLDAWISGECRVPALLLRTAWTILGLAGLGVSIVLPIVAHRLLGEGTILALVGLPLVVGSAFCFWTAARSSTTRVAAVFAVSAVTFMLTLFGFGAVEVGRHQTSRTFAEVIHRQSASGSPVVETFGYWRPSLVYYLGSEVRQMFNDDQARQFCQKWPDSGFLVTTAERYARLAPSLPDDVTVLARQRWFLRPDELLLLGREKPADARLGALRREESANH
jgi:4-amino-4-deoxy-L-arabinose transferase-like glycosyltransferase